MLNIAMNVIIQNNFMEIYSLSQTVIYGILLWANQETNVLFTSFLPNFNEKGACCDCVWYDECLGRIYQN